MRYSDDRIPAVEFEGRKYRSHVLLTRAIADADQRDKALAMLDVRPRMQRINQWIAWLYAGLAFLAVNALLDYSSGFGMGRHIPQWVSVLLVVVGLWGFFLSVRLDRLLERGENGHKSRQKSLKLTYLDRRPRA